MTSNPLFCCSQCSFVAKFETALTMHRQLYHEMLPKNEESSFSQATKQLACRPHSAHAKCMDISDCKHSKSPNYAPSTTKFLNRLYTKFSKSKFFGHTDHYTTDQDIETTLVINNDTKLNSKKTKDETTALTNKERPTNDLKKDHYGCHLCLFTANRITVLDRHLLNDHQIGLDNLLKLVMAKTKESLAENDLDLVIKTPYYKQPNEIIQEGDLVIENVTPKIRILKHAGVNTDLKFTDIPLLDENCRLLNRELETIIQKSESPEEELITKMKVLNDYMCKFVDSSNTLKKVLNKEYSKSRQNFKEKGVDESHYEFALGDQIPRKCEQTQSEKFQRSKRPSSYNDKDYDRNNSIF